MPFACEESTITTGLEGFGDGGEFSGELGAVLRGEDFVVALPVLASFCANPIGDAQAGGILSGHDGGARGGADLAGGVSVREAHAGFGEGIDVGCFVEGGAFDGEVLDAEVIG